MKKIRLLLVDDHFVVRVGLASSLNLEDDLVVVAEAESSTSALRLYAEHKPDLVIMDWRMPDGAGGEALRTLRAAHPEARVLVLSAFESEEVVFQAVHAGALGYVPKSARRPELLQSIREAASGRDVFGPEISAKLARRLRRPELTEREIEVLAQLVRGNSNKEIASNLDISENTVKLHLTHIMQKLKAKDRTHAASIALQRGIVDA